MGCNFVKLQPQKAGIGYFGCELKYSAFPLYSMSDIELTGNEMEF